MMNDESTRVGIPLIVGVTGHRDLVDDEISSIRDCVYGFFVQLKREHPGTPVVVMSPLAEGADSLVAEVALELDLPLWVPLPKPRAEYLRDFSTQAGRERFETLCGQAEHVFELSANLPPAPAQFITEVWTKDYPYAQLGIYLSAHSHILLAIWDGCPSKNIGGTAQVVHYHLENKLPGVLPDSVASQRALVDDENDLVYHIRCSRQKSADNADGDKGPITSNWLSKNQKDPVSSVMPASHRVIFRRCEEFAGDASRHAAQIEQYGNSLMVASEEVSGSAGLVEIDRLFRMADWLAIRYQTLSLQVLRLTHVLAFLMGLLLILYSDLAKWEVFLLAFLGLFVTAAGLQFVSRRCGWHRRYLDYRTLAEGLRIQFYWAAAGVNDREHWMLAHDTYLQSQDPEFGWIRNIMRIAGVSSNAAPESTQEGLQFAIRHWVGDEQAGQLAYFKYKAKDRLRRNRLTERFGRLSLVVSVVCVISLILFAQRIPDIGVSLLSLAMGVTLLFYAIREGYCFATAVKELMKKYEYMLGIFDNAHRRLLQASNDQERRNILLALGQSALDENSEWLMMHRDRTLNEAEVWRLGS